MAPNCNISYVASFADQCLALQEGKADAIFEDGTSIDYMCGQNDYMIADGIITNCVCNELGRDEFETQIKEGTFDFSAYPQIAEKFAQIPQYMMEGSSNYTDDDVIAVLTDGSVAMAVAGNRRVTDLDEDQLGVMARFEDPRMASMSAAADAAVKIAAADHDFAGTDVFYEMQGFDAATIARIQAQKRRLRGMNLLAAAAGPGDE